MNLMRTILDLIMHLGGYFWLKKVVKTSFTIIVAKNNPRTLFLKFQSYFKKKNKTKISSCGEFSHKNKI